MQDHLDRLSSTDASFLHQEGRSSHMHIGGVLIFEGPPPALDEFLDHIRGRLHLVPRYRQKLVMPPLGTGRPLWVDDPDFNLSYHVRHTALPEPGSEAQLLRLAARIASQRLDRSKPLWENWLVEGLDGDRFAIISKTHHALVDGIAGVDLATVIFDLEREPPRPSEPLAPWQPHPEPSGAELLAAGVRGMVRATTSMAVHAVAAAARPSTSLNLLRDAVEGLGEIVWAGLNPAPETPLNVPIGPHRRFAIVRQQLADYKSVKDTLGGTVNDVVLTVVAGALAHWLRSRGVRTQGLEMRALVPVSVRGAQQRGALGNRLTVMRGPLPVYIADPVARLRYVRAAMDGLKESKQAVGAATLVAVNNLAPPTILAQASRLNFSTRLFNLLVTNVPGPQMPLYVLGRRLQDLFPIAFLPENHALAVAIMSYDGNLDYGLLGDYDAMPDLDVVAEGIERSLTALLSAARGQSPPARPRRRRGGGRSTAARPPAVDGAGPTAGRATAGRRIGGVTTAEEPIADDVSVGEPATDEARAGEVTAREARAGEPGADEARAGEPAPIVPKDRSRTTGPAADMRAKRAGRGRRSRSRPSRP